jgi:hypothetical protein
MAVGAGVGVMAVRVVMPLAPEGGMVGRVKSSSPQKPSSAMNADVKFGGGNFGIRQSHLPQDQPLFAEDLNETLPLVPEVADQRPERWSDQPVLDGIVELWPLRWHKQLDG